MIKGFFVRKNTKIGLIVTICLISIALILCLLFYLRVEVNVVMSQEEAVLLDNYFNNKLISNYRIKKTIYPEISNSKYHLFTPLAGIFAQNDSTIPNNSAVYGLEAVEGFDLVFETNEINRYSIALDLYKKLNCALLYNSSNIEEEKLSQNLNFDLKISYEGYISKIEAEKIKKELDQKRIGTIVIINPSNALNLIQLSSDLTVTVPTLFGYTLENYKPTYILCEDYNQMIKSLIKGNEGSEQTPFITLPFKKSFKVF